MTAEQEVERLLQEVLKGTSFEHSAFAVGGFVRDGLLGIESKDLDIVVEKPDGARELAQFIHDRFPDEVTNPHNMGAGYPIHQITFKKNVGEFKTAGAVIEFADTQKESFPDPTTRQRMTIFGTLEEDVKRRDFTINMLMRDLSNGLLIDMANGHEALKNGILDGHPEVDPRKTFSDDPLRMLRLVRFVAKFGFKVSDRVREAVRESKERIVIVSAERVRDELIKMMLMGKLAESIELMDELGLLPEVLPEISVMRGVEHDTSRGFHMEGDVFNHVMLVVKNAKPTVTHQLGALLHDIAKPATQEIKGDKITFIGHEDVGEGMATDTMKRLKFDSNTISDVALTVKHHMRPHALVRHGLKMKSVRKLMRKVGDKVDLLLDLVEADSLGNLPVENHVPQIREMVKEASAIPMKAKGAVLNGKEIMEVLGVSPGPIIGRVTNFLKDKEDDFASEGEILSVEKAKELVLERFG